MTHGNVFTQSQLARFASRAIIIAMWPMFFVGEVATEDGGPDIICIDPVVEKEHLVVDCRLENQLGTDIFVPSERIALEGPRERFADPRYEDTYFYLYVAGDRYENVLHYNKFGVKLNELSKQLRPSIQPSLKDIENLRRVSPGENLDIRISWALGTDRPFLTTSRWVLRAKMIYALDDSFARLVRGEDIRDECKESIRIARSRPPADGEAMQLLASYPLPVMQNPYDGCRDVIAREFRHIFSNEVNFSIP